MIEYESRKLYTLDINLLNPDPDQPRKHMDETALNELTDSIKSLGVLQPILFKVENEKHIIVAGERRYQAAKNAGINLIPAIYIDSKSDEISLVENIIRENLSAVEEAEAFQRMKDKYSYTDELLSSTLGKGRSTITQTLSINKLPEEIKDECRKDVSCPRGRLIEIARLETSEDMIKLYKKMKKQNLTREEIKKERSKSTEKVDGKLNTFIKSLARELNNAEIKGKIVKIDQIKEELCKLREIIDQFLKDDNQ